MNEIAALPSNRIISQYYVIRKDDGTKIKMKKF